MLPQLYERRPFKVRNADEYNLDEVLELFVNPLIGYRNPFEYENNIVKGKMGTGKTMYLKANYVFYLYSMIPSLIEKEPLYLPVFLKLNDFQHIKRPDEIYRSIILSIVENILKLYLDLRNVDKMVAIHCGVRSLPSNVLKVQKFDKVMSEIIKLNADEYVKTIKHSFNVAGSVAAKFLELSSRLEKEEAVEIRKKSNPGIADVKMIYEYLLRETGGRVLLLIDEAAALDKSFFREKGGAEPSFFEILMNQLRTQDFIRTKIAVYPNSFSDILAETRYGDVVSLEDDVMEEDGYTAFRGKTIDIVGKYLSNVAERKIEVDEVFDLNTAGKGDCIEQIINGSGGTMRRLVQLLDLSMLAARERNGGNGKVEGKDTLEGLKKQAQNMEEKYTAPDREFLHDILRVCRKRGSYKFQFPYKAPVLSKYLFKSEEQNILQVVETGMGRRGTTYAFDYVYCVFQDIPTHFLIGTERIDKERSRKTGRWIPRIIKISKDLIEQAGLQGKIDGNIEYVHKGIGITKGDDGKDYFLTNDHVIESDKNKHFVAGKRVRFYPAVIQGAAVALNVEIL